MNMRKIVKEGVCNLQPKTTKRQFKNWKLQANKIIIESAPL